MLELLPDDLRPQRARPPDMCAHAAPKLTLCADGRRYPILRFWAEGFALAAGAAPHLRGRVDIHDGARHAFQCLIVVARDCDDEIVYEFKRITPAADSPPADFVPAASAASPGGVGAHGH